MAKRFNRMNCVLAISGAAALILSAIGTKAHAAVVISKDATANMACSGGICAPTKTSAVLNVSDLENLLASGNTTVTTKGDGIDASDLRVNTALSWTSANTLSLTATHQIEIDKPVAITGPGGLSVTTRGAVGDFYFGGKGSVTFLSTSNSLSIDGNDYALVDNIASLASAVVANPNGDYALANSYDARQDGVYATSPIAINFSGRFEGLGNTVSHFQAKYTSKMLNGFFSDLAGVVENFTLAQINIISTRKAWVGGLVAANAGTLAHDEVSGKIRSNAEDSVIGGIVGYNATTILASSANIQIFGTDKSSVGGVIGRNSGDIIESYASGSTAGGDEANIGGLIGFNQHFNTDPFIDNSYSTAAASGGTGALVGGLVGRYTKSPNGSISMSYSTGRVSGGDSAEVGGLIGSVAKKNIVSDSYWDVTTSGTSQGVGSGSSVGITGLTDIQMKSGLPDGFDAAIWAQSPKINNGYPYLIGNPPAK